MPGPDREREEADAAAAEAGAIGGRTSSETTPPDEAERPVAEAGGGEAEGFEQAEAELVENASHGDQHAARRAITDAPDWHQDARAAEAGEPDVERSSERDEDTP